jgi:hypothetical protein
MIFISFSMTSKIENLTESLYIGTDDITKTLAYAHSFACEIQDSQPYMAHTIERICREPINKSTRIRQMLKRVILTPNMGTRFFFDIHFGFPFKASEFFRQITYRRRFPMLFWTENDEFAAVWCPDTRTHFIKIGSISYYAIQSLQSTIYVPNLRNRVFHLARCVTLDRFASKIQRRWRLWRHARRVIVRAIQPWLNKPRTSDGRLGIRCRIAMRHFYDLDAFPLE